MSHAIGAIKFGDGLIRFYEYNGTSDYVISYHYRTPDQVSENWRSSKHVECDCGEEEPVSIYSSYGGGFYMDGYACKFCNSVRTEHPYDFDTIEREDMKEDWEKFVNWESPPLLDESL